MKKNKYIIMWSAAVALVLLFVCLQFIQFCRGLRTANPARAQEILVNALSTQVLSPNVDEDEQQLKRSEPLLDQYRKNPAFTHQRYLLVMTWLHASQILEAVNNWSAFDGKMVSSNSLSNILAETRVDGWQNPYCIWLEGNQVVFISSGGNGISDCNVLRTTAQKAAAVSRDARLTRVGNFLVTVQERRTIVAPSIMRGWPGGWPTFAFFVLAKVGHNSQVMGF